MLRPLVSCVLVLVSLVVLEMARSGVVITDTAVGDTPVTMFEQADATGPAVVIAHGFAGSRQMMQGYALPLARAGYRVHVFDFLGHGRHRLPMSGDVTSVEGTTRLLVDQTRAVIAAARSDDRPVALVGHSMATDILVRIAFLEPDTGPVVLISAFSQVVDETTPRTALFITGAWEARLREFALDAVRMVTPGAGEGDIAEQGDVTRRAVVAPFAEHVSVLQSRAGRGAAVDWLNRFYGRGETSRILPTGWAILGLLGGLVMLFAPVMRRFPVTDTPITGVAWPRFAALIGVPMIAAPLIAVPLDPGILPVLVADYLALHLVIYGVIQLALLRLSGVRFGGFAPGAFAMFLVWCAVFGVALDRYAANFMPTGDRIWIIAVLALGTVPFMLADAALAHGAGFWRRMVQRIGFFASLGIAMTLDFEGLFFLLLIAPVVVLFYLVFGGMGRSVSKRTGPLVPGLVQGLVLAWALGVSFPLFQS